MCMYTGCTHDGVDGDGLVSVEKALVVEELASVCLEAASEDRQPVPDGGVVHAALVEGLLGEELLLCQLLGTTAAEECVQ